MFRWPRVPPHSAVAITPLVAALSFTMGCATGQTDRQQSQIADHEISAIALNHLDNDRFFSARDLKIKTENGIATLIGTVNDVRSKERALRTIENIKGVSGVIDRLNIATISKSDEQIRTDVESALLLDATTESYEVEPSVSNGVVTLRGEVDSWQEKQLAGWVAKGIRGVKSVFNNIDVTFAADRPPDEVSQDIRGALKLDPFLAGETIAIDVIDNKAYLSGTVASAAQKNRLYSRAWVGGIKDVDVSKVQVDPNKPTDLAEPRRYTEISDAEIGKAVVDALIYDPRVYSFNPSVSVKNKVVTLTGIVSSLKAKRAAQSDAENVIGVNGVINQLKVLTERRDAEIEKDVRALLNLDPNVDTRQIQVTSQKGLVRLDGAVDTFFERWTAEDTASRVDGVVDVQNNLKVPAGVALNDDPGIKVAVEQNIKRNVLFDDDDQINVSVSQGKVTLTGIVDNWTEHATATTEAFQGGAATANEKQQTSKFQSATLKEISKKPLNWKNKNVMIQGEVDRVLSPNGLVLSDDGFVDHKLLVVSKKPLSDHIKTANAPVQEDDELNVSGKIQNYSVIEVEREYGMDLHPEIEAEFKGIRPVLIVDSLRITKKDDYGDN